jgi:hypothetical protein
VKPVCFLGDSLQCLRDFPEDARHDAGYQPDRVQRGQQPDDFKSMPSVGKGVEEIRVSEAAARIASFTWRGEPTRFTYCVRFRRRRRPLRRGISIRRSDGLLNW